MKVRNRIISFLLVMVLLVSTVPTSVFAASDTMYGIGFVTGSKVRLRSEASTDSKIVDNANKGEVVVVVSKQGEWYKVIYDLKEGYMHSDYVKASTAENASAYPPLLSDTLLLYNIWTEIAIVKRLYFFCSRPFFVPKK